MRPETGSIQSRSWFSEQSGDVPAMFQGTKMRETPTLMVKTRVSSDFPQTNLLIMENELWAARCIDRSSANFGWYKHFATLIK